MTGGGEPLTHAEEAFLDAHSGTTPLTPEAMARVVAAGRAARAAAEEAGLPGVPHIEAIVDAFPSNHRDALSVSRWIDSATIDHMGGEVGVREWLEAGHDPEPVIALARRSDCCGT